MSEKEIIKQLKKLPSEAQREAADFVEFLSEKYLQQPEETDSPKKIYFRKFISGNVERSERNAR